MLRDGAEFTLAPASGPPRGCLLGMRAAVRREVRWRTETGEGLEHLTLSADSEGGIRAESVVIGDRDGLLYGVRYSIRCDRG